MEDIDVGFVKNTADNIAIKDMFVIAYYFIYVENK